MSSETLLKRDFQKKDVQRMRNLLSKKYGNKTMEMVGYQSKVEEHQEGDIWEENDKTWTIKNGIKQTYTKLDDIKKAYRLPISCPKCSNRMNNRLDKKMFPLHGMCHICVISYESQLKLQGKYEEYAKNIMKNNAISYVAEAKDFILDFASENESGFITEDGTREDWDGGNNKNIVERITKELEEFEKQIENI